MLKVHVARYGDAPVGTPLSISVSQPKGIVPYETVQFLVPPWDIVGKHKREKTIKGVKADDEYTAAYYSTLYRRMGADTPEKLSQCIATMLRVFAEPQGITDITLYCWCARDAFCHRFLVHALLPAEMKGTMR